MTTTTFQLSINDMNALLLINRMDGWMDTNPSNMKLIGVLLFHLDDVTIHICIRKYASKDSLLSAL